MTAPTRTTQNTLTALVALLATAVQAHGMWLFFEHRMHVTNPWLRAAFFGFIEACLLVSALRARRTRIATGRASLDDAAVWGLAILGGTLSASDTTGWAATARFIAPLVAAWMFERAITAERADRTGTTDTTLTRILRRTRARLGLLDALDQDDRATARATMAGKLAVARYRAHQEPEGSAARRRAERKYQRKVRTAIERYGLATDPDMIAAVRSALAAMYAAVDATTRAAVADANPWTPPTRSALLPPPPLPAPAPTPPQPAVPAHGPGNGRTRRTADETRRLYTEIRSTRPGLTQKDYATALGISDRALRDALNATRETA